MSFYKLSIPRSAQLLIAASVAWLGLFLCSMTMAIVTPPFQAPDEGVHYLYARGVSIGQLFPASLGEGLGTGAVMPSKVGQLMAIFDGIAFEPSAKYTLERRTAAGNAVGLDAQPYSYSGASLYPPMAYIAPGLAMAIAGLAGATELEIFYAGRLANALLFSAAAAIALLLSRGRMISSMSILVLPMTIFQSGSLSADGFVFSAATVAIALMIEAEAVKASTWRLLLAGLLVICAATTKLPLIALVLPLAGASWKQSKSIASLNFVMPVAVTAVWVLLLAPVNSYMDGRPSSIRGQINFIVNNLPELKNIIITTVADFGKFYYESAIGILGWLDTPLSSWFYVVCAFLVFLVFVVSIGQSAAYSVKFRVMSLGGLLAGIVLTYLSLYLVWTPVGTLRIEGVQGRYLLPLLMLAFVIFQGMRPIALANIVIPILVFLLGIISYFESLTTLLFRYYIY